MTSRSRHAWQCVGTVPAEVSDQSVGAVFRFGYCRRKRACHMQERATSVKECPIKTADRHLAKWAIRFVSGLTQEAPKRGWHRFLRDGFSQSHDEWRRRYRLYTKSNPWKQRRTGALKRAEHKCALCGSERRLQVHHTHYANVGMEPMEDLRVLCAGCHKTVHATWRTTPVPMDANTAAIVKQRRIEREQLAAAQPFLDEMRRRAEAKAMREGIKAHLSGEIPKLDKPRIRRRPKPAEATA
jgi:5-methylcytosine-specific restriction endonuclease McrA